MLARSVFFSFCAQLPSDRTLDRSPSAFLSYTVKHAATAVYLRPLHPQPQQSPEKRETERKKRRESRGRPSVGLEKRSAVIAQLRTVRKKRHAQDARAPGAPWRHNAHRGRPVCTKQRPERKADRVAAIMTSSIATDPCLTLFFCCCRPQLRRSDGCAFGPRGRSKDLCG